MVSPTIKLDSISLHALLSVCEPLGLSKIGGSDAERRRPKGKCLFEYRMSGASLHLSNSAVARQAIWRQF